eukprot:jgi/Mesvir1/1930/Mv22956-RA.1
MLPPMAGTLACCFEVLMARNYAGYYLWSQLFPGVARIFAACAGSIPWALQNRSRAGSRTSSRRPMSNRACTGSVQTMPPRAQRQYRPSNEDEWGFFRKITFSWVTPLVKHGTKTPLMPAHLCTLTDDMNAEHLGLTLSQMWTAHVDKCRAEHKRQVAAGTAKHPHPRYSLVSVLLHMQWCGFLATGLCLLVVSVIRVSQAILLRKLIETVNEAQDVDKWKGYVFAVLLGFSALCLAAIQHNFQCRGSMIGMRMRVACMTKAHRKLLRLSTAGLANTTSGQCVNLVAADVRRFDDGPLYFHYVWAAPLELLAVALLVGSQLGWQPALAGTCSLVAFIPLQAFFGRQLARCRRTTIVFADSRIKMTWEVLQGILGVKIFGWEPAFAASISKIRSNEQQILVRSAMVRAFNEALHFVVHLIMALVTFATTIAVGGELTKAKVFFAVSLFNLPRLWMGSYFPLAIEKISECYVTCQRLQRFLLIKEAQGTLKTHSHGLSVGVRAGTLDISPPPSMVRREMSAIPSLKRLLSIRHPVVGEPATGNAAGAPAVARQVSIRREVGPIPVVANANADVFKRWASSTRVPVVEIETDPAPAGPALPLTAGSASIEATPLPALHPLQTGKGHDSTDDGGGEDLGVPPANGWVPPANGGVPPANGGGCHQPMDGCHQPMEGCHQPMEGYLAPKKKTGQLQLRSVGPQMWVC